MQFLLGNMAATQQQVEKPVKQFMRDSDGLFYAVTRNEIFISTDSGMNFISPMNIPSHFLK